MRRILFFLLSITVVLFCLCACCLRHTPGAEATCTEPQLCTKCSEMLVPATGHTPGDGPTCTTAQICSTCGEELAPATGHISSGTSCTEDEFCTVCGEILSVADGHEVDADTGICSDCDEQVTEPGINYIKPGAHGESSEDAASVLSETLNEGHYNNNTKAYYRNAVLVCGDYGIEYFNLNESGYSYYAGVISNFAAKYPQLNISCMIVPKAAVYESPDGFSDPHDGAATAIANTYAMMPETVHTVDAMSIMDQHAGEYMFYRTDHHWTSLGAYYASVAYCEANSITARDLESYETVIRTGVIGSLNYYAGGVASLKTNPDYTVLHFPATGYSMKYTRGSGWSSGVALNPNNSGYASVFMGGDLPLTVINTDNKNGKTLMIFKESYGNAFAPYMIDYYENIIVVDIRADTDSVASLIERYTVTDVLFINNCQAITSLTSYVEEKCMS